MPFTRRSFGCFGAWPRTAPPEQNRPRTSDLRRTQDAGSLSLRERARVRGTRRCQSKWPEEFCKLNANASLSQSWLSHRAKSLSMVVGRALASALVFRAFLPPHPALSLGERENRRPVRGESNALGRAGVSALNRAAHVASGSDVQPKKDAPRQFPLPAGEGKGEGEGGLQLSGTRRLAWRGALFSFAQSSRLHRQFASALVCGALLPPHPGPLPEERENRTPRF
jgi:hypothetical protein